MKHSTMRLVLVMVVLVLALGACKGRGEKAANGEDPTATIAPAAPQPHETGTDAMTQTVDIEDSRTDAEGGVLTNPNPPVTTGTTTAATGTTTTTTTTTTAPPATPTTTR